MPLPVAHTERGTLSLWHNKHEVPKAELNGHGLVTPTISVGDALAITMLGKRQHKAFQLNGSDS